MTKTTITFEDVEDGGVSANLEVDGKNEGKVEFTPAMLFAEAIMRCVNSEGSIWGMVKIFVPEAFESSEEGGNDNV